MSEWPLTCLDELIDVKHGFAFKGHEITTDKTECVLVTPGNFAIGGGWKDSKKYLRGYPPKEYEFSPGDLVVTMTDLSKETDTLGYSAKIPNDGRIYAHNQRVGRVVIKGGDPEFLYWLMRTREYQWHCVASASGTAVMHTSPSRIKEFEFNCPPLDEQEAIAEVLSSLDDKIDLLKRQNKTLEGMAEALFRQWFIEEAPDDWDELPFGEVFDFTMGQSPPGSSFNEEGVGMPMYQGNADFGMRFPSARVYTTEPKRMAGPGDVLMSVRAPVGAMNMAKEKCCIGRGVAAFRFKEEPSFDTYTLYKIKAMISEFMVFNDQGTVFGSIGKGDLLQMVVTSPPFNLIEKFEAEVGPMDHKIRANANEIRLLERQRDTLLPKLMSGEVRVQMD